MSYVLLYAVTVVVFLGLDAVGLRLIVKPVFDRHIGDMLREPPHYAPALVFYLFYVVGLVWFVSAPALRDDTALVTVFVLGGFFGAVAYGTYEFSNMATLKGWTWSMLATDLVWGTVLTGTSAVAGVAAVRAIS